MAATQLPAGASKSERELLAAAEAAYLDGDDLAALAGLEKLLGEVGESLAAADAVRLRLAMAQARAGQGTLALATLAKVRDAQKAPLAVAATRARALADQDDAESLAAWHELWSVAQGSGQQATAQYARFRATRAWRLSGPEMRIEAQELSADKGAKRCLELRNRAPGVRASEKWQAQCVAPAAVIGVLLPRTGRFAGLADRHLAALSVGLSLVPPDVGDMVIRFADAGAGAAASVDGANALIAQGATILIGPVSERSTKAVVEAVGDRARVITPGPSAAPATAMSVSLEARVDALLARGAENGCLRRGFVLTRVEGAYGTRARDRVVAVSQGDGPKSLTGLKILKDLTYPSSATSFAPVLAKAKRELQAKACVLVLDTLARTEGVARQLRRDGRTLGPGGTVLLSTAEGLDAGAIDGRPGLADIEVAPVALPEARSAFQDAYRVNTGHAADDQALLIWRALRLALWELAPPSGAQLGRFDAGGRLETLDPSGDSGGDSGGDAELGGRP